MSTGAALLEAFDESNPLLEGLTGRRTPDPCSIVIFGASGDLSHRKLLPGLYALAFNGLLPESFAVLGVGRRELADDAFRAQMRAAVEEHGRLEFDEDVWRDLAQGMRYVAATDTDEPAGGPITDALKELEEERGTLGNRVFYLAVPPAAMTEVVSGIATWPAGGGWRRLIVEKPFGNNLASARELNGHILERFPEREVFRIDHYLGKETVQNLAVLRFANGIFEPVWNRQFIDHVQITAAESIGIGSRAAFYEETGATRDIFQNHLLQLLTLTAMEPSADFAADAVRNEKVKVLKSLAPLDAGNVVRGQYGEGFAEGSEVLGYRAEEGVAADSATETYFAAKLQVDNWRWAGTPFYLRCGKRLARRETAIAIQFKRAPHLPFELDAEDDVQPNVLLIHIQPDEGISMTLNAKVPGYGVTIRAVNMDFAYGGSFRTGLPEAYERLILDCMLGDAVLFTRADEVEEQWALVDGVRERWNDEQPQFPNYAAGSWGPAAADELVQADGRSWRRH
ncbi:MAG: glucose-6-phosphate dehydrogenase [Gaiellaceae bacterium]